jgi:hypothetical protein
VGRVKDFDNKEEYEFVTEPHMKNQILFDYMYRIPPNHRKLKSIQNIIRLAEKNNIKILFYISPADVEFMEKYFEQLPTQLKRDLESSEEIFLYSQGLLPVLWKRRGRSFELRSIKHESVAMTFFRKPSEYEKSAPRYAAEESYFDAMKRASKSLKLKNRKNH